MSYSTHPITPEDEPFLWQMLYDAAHLHDEEDMSLPVLKKHPQLGKYVRDWGREGDLGFVAIANEIDANNKIGAAWLRLFPSTDPGYGYLDDRIPELAIAVLPQYRGQGVGTQLLDRLLAAAKPKFPAISLSVRDDNPAVKLYRRFGFEAIEESETVNRVGGRSFNMKIDLV